MGQRALPEWSVVGGLRPYEMHVLQSINLSIYTSPPGHILRMAFPNKMIRIKARGLSA